MHVPIRWSTLLIVVDWWLFRFRRMWTTI